MRAYFVDSPGVLRLDEAPTPEPQEGEILMRSLRVSICVTDVYYYRGKVEPPRWPFIPGHEYLGEVVASRHQQVEVGDRVVYWGGTEFGGLAEYRSVLPIFPDTLDEKPWLDPRGFYDAGGPAAVVVDGKLSAAEATFLEPMCSVLRTLLVCPPLPGDRALVLGAGPIGLIAIQLFRNYFACAGVTVLEKDPAKLAMAASLGADVVLDTGADRPALDALARDSRGEHAQYVLDTLSDVNDDVRDIAMELCARDGVYNVFGATPKPQLLSTWHVLAKGIRLRSTPFDVGVIPMRRSAAALALAQRLVLHGMVKVAPLVTTTANFLDLPAVQEAFDGYGRSGSLKTSIRFDTQDGAGLSQLALQPPGGNYRDSHDFDMERQQSSRPPLGSGGHETSPLPGDRDPGPFSA